MRESTSDPETSRREGDIYSDSIRESVSLALLSINKIYLYALSDLFYTRMREKGFVVCSQNAVANA